MIYRLLTSHFNCVNTVYALCGHYIVNVTLSCNLTIKLHLFIWNIASRERAMDPRSAWQWSVTRVAFVNCLLWASNVNTECDTKNSEMSNETADCMVLLLVQCWAKVASSSLCASLALFALRLFLLLLRLRRYLLLLESNRWVFLLSASTRAHAAWSQTVFYVS